MIEEIKAKILDAVRNKRVVEKNILKLLLGEIQNLEASKNKALDKKEIYTIIKLFIKNNEETIALSKGSVEDLKTENLLLNQLLPESFTQPELSRIINSNPKLLTDILNAKNVGQAIGMAKKEISSLYTKEIPGADLKLVIESIKNAT